MGCKIDTKSNIRTKKTSSSGWPNRTTKQQNWCWSSKTKLQPTRRKMKKSKLRQSIITKTKLKRSASKKRNNSIRQPKIWLSSMIILTNCKKSVKKSWNMNWSWWLGSKIARVWRKLFKRRSIRSRLSRLVWNNRCRNSMLSLSNNLSNRPSKMLKETFKKLREIFILKTRNLLRRLWVRDILSTTIKEKNNSSTETKKSSKEISLSSKVLLTNMNKEVLLSKRRLRFSRKRSLYSRSLSSRSSMISKRRKSYLSSTTNKSLRTREKTSKTCVRVSDKRIRSSKTSGP